MTDRYIVTALSSSPDGRAYAEHIRVIRSGDDGPFYSGFLNTPLAAGDRPTLCGALLVGGWDTRLVVGEKLPSTCASCLAAFRLATDPPKPTRAPKPPKPVKPPRPKRYRGEYAHMETATGIGGYAAWTDGSGTLQEAPAAIGVIIAVDGVVVCETSEYIHYGTNNVAEVRAIGRALALAFAVMGDRGPLTIFSDSEFAIGAVRHGSRWDIRTNEALGKLVVAVRNEVARWPDLTFKHVKGHSGNLGNERCDWLAGRARKAHIAGRAAMNPDADNP